MGTRTDVDLGLVVGVLSNGRIVQQAESGAGRAFGSIMARGEPLVTSLRWIDLYKTKVSQIFQLCITTVLARQKYTHNSSHAGMFWLTSVGHASETCSTTESEAANPTTPKERILETHVYRYSIVTYLKTNGKESEQFQAHLMAKIVELANLGLIVQQTCGHGLLSLTVVKLFEIERSKQAVRLSGLALARYARLTL